jgi:membrane-bound lytic murein transglycosylase
MRYPTLTILAPIAAALCLSACNQSKPTADASRTGDASRVGVTDAQQDRDQDINRLDKRLDDLDQKWADKEKKLIAERATATASMRANVKDDLENARKAVADLRTTTPENWWTREEAVLTRTTAELEQDVRNFTGRKSPVGQAETTSNPEKETAFEARRDQFIDRIQPRVTALNNQLKDLKAKGTEKTERNDTIARAQKLNDDLSELRKASPDDWWKISDKRVTDYIDRLDKSISRLDDNKSNAR